MTVRLWEPMIFLIDYIESFLDQLKNKYKLSLRRNEKSHKSDKAKQINFIRILIVYIEGSRKAKKLI
jgi:hypothetical protein